MRRSSLAAALALALLAPSARSAEIKGWFMAGSDPASYEMVKDPDVRHGGATSVRMASTNESKGFGTIMQMINATHYAGKRVRLSAWVKTQDVASWAGLWMRVDDASNPPKSLAFDNMQGRPFRGTADWATASVVLDVASEAKAVAFGILMDGQGKLWISDIKFEVVSNSVPTTNMAGMDQKRSDEPENLDFKK